MVVLVKAVKATKLREDVFRLELLNELRKAGTAVKQDFDKTTRTWAGDKPKFETAVSLANGGPTLLVEPTGGKGAKKWAWLDKGTKVRYATMTSNFVPKTQVRSLSSGSGRGGVAFVNKKRPRPGIEAREWSIVITEKWRTPMKRRMEKAMARAAKKSGHG